MEVEQTVILGDGWATCLLKLILFRPLGSVYRLHRAVVPTIVVVESRARVGPGLAWFAGSARRGGPARAC
eukprot:2309986-Pyramimonas_sp.AAC.1